MKTARALLALSLTARLVSAFNANQNMNHPFLGEHANARIISTEDRSTHRVEKKNFNLQKYGEITNQKSFGRRKSPMEKV